MGYTSRFLTLTKGTGVITESFTHMENTLVIWKVGETVRLYLWKQGKLWHLQFLIYKLEEMLVTHNDQFMKE